MTALSARVRSLGTAHSSRAQIRQHHSGVRILHIEQLRQLASDTHTTATSGTDTLIRRNPQPSVVELFLHMIVTIVLPVTLPNPRNHNRSKRSTRSSTSCHDHGFTNMTFHRSRTLLPWSAMLVRLCNGHAYSFGLYMSPQHSAHTSPADVLSTCNDRVSLCNLQQSASFFFFFRATLNLDWAVSVLIAPCVCSDLSRSVLLHGVTDIRWTGFCSLGGRRVPYPGNEQDPEVRKVFLLAGLGFGESHTHGFVCIDGYLRPGYTHGGMRSSIWKQRVPGIWKQGL